MVAESFKLQEFFMKLDSIGLTDVLLPFLLFFVIVYAILQKTNILGEGKKNLNAAVGIVVALLVVVPHVTGRFPENVDPVVIINNALPQISIVLVAIIFLLVLIGVFGQDMVMLGIAAPGWITLLSLITILLIFGGAAGWWSNNFGTGMEDFFGTEGIAIFIMIVMFGIIIAWVTSDSKEGDKEKQGLKRLGIDVDQIFKKK